MPGEVMKDESTVRDLTPIESTIARAIQGGGSGRGMSYYSSASRCGRRQRLSDARQAEFAQDGATPALPTAKNALVIGSTYHLLHQQWREPRSDVVLDFSGAFYNINVIEALRMFRGFKNIWGRDYWGRHIAVERRLPTEAHAGNVKRLFGADVTGTLDMVVELDAADADRCQRRVPGITPGRYIIDWKTADLESDGVAMTLGLQTKWYPALWNLCFPSQPVAGIIFDIALKRSRRKDRTMYANDFQAVLVRDVLPAQEAARILKPMVQQGLWNVLNDRPNRAECVDWTGKVCPFFKNTCELEGAHVDFGDL